MSCNYFLSRPKISCSLMTDPSADTESQVGLPSGIVLQQQALTHFLFFLVDVMKLGPNAQYVQHAAAPLTNFPSEVRVLDVFQPCSRLGHPCDYNPRLSFKNDTPRVIEKMTGVAGSGGPVWDCMYSLSCYSPAA